MFSETVFPGTTSLDSKLVANVFIVNWVCLVQEIWMFLKFYNADTFYFLYWFLANTTVKSLSEEWPFFQLFFYVQWWQMGPNSMLPCTWNLHTMYNPCNIFTSILAIVQFRKHWPGAIQMLYWASVKVSNTDASWCPLTFMHIQEKHDESPPVPRWFLNSLVFCRLLKSYNSRFICDIIDCSTISHEKQTISRLFLFYIFAWMVLFLLLQCGKTHLLNSQFSLTQNNQLRLKTTSLKSH